MTRPALILLVAWCAAVPAWAQAPAPGDLVINEVMYDPPAPQASANEWVEVLNVSGAPVDLDGLALTDGTSTSGTIASGTTLAPGAYLILIRNEDEFTAAYPGVPYVLLSSFPSLNNSGDRPALVLGTTEIDAVPYQPSWGGTDASLERRDPSGASDDAANFGTTTDSDAGTPGEQNSLFTTDDQPPTLVSAEALDAQSVLVTFDEALDESSAQAPDNYQVDGGIGAPASATLQGDRQSVVLTLATPLVSPTTYTLTTQNVADDAGNASGTQQTTFFFGQGEAALPGDLVINEFLYDEPTTNNPGEFVELVNRTAKSFDLRDFTLNDNTGDDAPITTQPAFVEPGGYAVIVEDGALFEAVFPGVPYVEQPAWSALNNTGDAIVLKYLGTAIDSLTYTPSWGGSDASVERKDPAGPSTTAANFATTTDPRGGSPGAQNSQYAPDVTGPMLSGAVASLDGRTVTVDVDEPLDPASVSASAFSVSGGPTVTAAVYDADELTVTLSLSAPLAAGSSTVSASGLRDLLGNTTSSTSTTVAFTPDTVLPTITRVTAPSATTLRVEFSEPVTDASASTPATYGVDGGIGQPASVTTEPSAEGGAEAVTLALAAPLTDGQTYSITATNLQDLAGNVQPSTSGSVFFGSGAAAGPRDLVINEFLYDEPAADNPGEFVELVNRTDQTFDLRDFTLNDNSGADEPITTDPVYVMPGGYAVIVEDGALFETLFPGVPYVEQAAWSALNNGGDALVLKYRGTTVDSLTYAPSWGGEDASLERKDPDGPSNAASNFATTTDTRGGTPGTQNTQYAPDVTGPQLTAAAASRDGRRLQVALDEPAEAATVTASAFAVTGTSVTDAAYTAGSTTVLLTLAGPIASGTATVTAAGLADLLGNVTASTSTSVAFTADMTPPTLVRATARSSSVVRVEFSEAVALDAATTPATYTLDGGIGAASAVTVLENGDDLGVAAGALVVDVTFENPLQERTLYTLTVGPVADLAGNVRPSSTARVFFGTADTPGAGDVVFTEIMYDPVNGAAGEYVELTNTTADGVFDLRSILLDDGDGDGAPLADEVAVLLPGESLAVVRDAAGFQATFPDAAFVEAGTVIGLSNSGEAVVLRSNGVVLDSVVYDPSWHRVELDDATGLSLERRDPAGPSNSASNWSTSLAEAGGTPSAPNSLTSGGAPVERTASLTVAPSPFAPSRGEATEITVTLSTEAALVRARIYDGGGRLVRELEPGRLTGSTAVLRWDGTGDDRRPLRAGLYVVLVEAVDAQGGTTEALRGVVTLARPTG